MAALAGEGWSLPEALSAALPKRKAEFMAGRKCAAAALRNAGCESLAPLGRDAEGVPCWPEGWLGAITHSHGLAAAAAAPRGPLLGIGLDAEAWMKAARAERLKGRILCPGEDALRPASMSFAEFVTLVFSAKESLFKALYPQVGRYFGFHAAELLALGEGALRLRLTEALAEGLPAGAELSGRYLALSPWVVTLITA